MSMAGQPKAGIGQPWTKNRQSGQPYRDDTTSAERAAQRWAREKEAKIRVRVSMWLTDGSCSDDGRVGAAAVYKHENQWRSRRGLLGNGCMQVFDTELRAADSCFM